MFLIVVLYFGYKLSLLRASFLIINYSAIYETRKHRFNQYKNTLRKTITEAKKRYCFNQFGRHEGNGKKTWKTIDNALHRKSRKAIPGAISVKTKLSTNIQEVANEFNKYFATICANNHIPTTNR